jgi:hypothetical protein
MAMDLNVTLVASIWDQDILYDARQHHLLVGSRQSKKQQGTGLNRIILVVVGQTGLILHGNRQSGMTKLLCHVMTGLERIRMEVFHMPVQRRIESCKYLTGVTVCKRFNGRSWKNK